MNTGSGSSGGSSGSGVDTSGRPSVNWSAYSCSQNLPAILNDPKRGKQVRSLKLRSKVD